MFSTHCFDIPILILEYIIVFLWADMFDELEIYVFMTLMFWFDDWISRDEICSCFIYKLSFLVGV